MKRAIIDLGTNTFHLLLVDENDQVILKLSRAAKIGMGGIEKGIITEEGILRGLAVLREYKVEIEKQQIPMDQVFAFGTSALRSAANQSEVLARFANETGIAVQVISGDREAELIYEGVKQAVEVSETSMIVDIGGGSVEFILCNARDTLWRQSFEIGGQRLMAQFFKEDPMPRGQISKMFDYFREKLLPLANAVHQYAPQTLIGSSGSFDTLNQIYYYAEKGGPVPQERVGNDYPLEEFQRAFELLLDNDREARMQIPGMIEMRVDMIVVAVCLIQFLIQNFQIKRIQVSKFAMKEGILAMTK
ncbi:phosphatase [Marinilongibacter aquaticus]|uniref:Ppx/GppA phosphatase family protein n=1 Tax=Marinilongibacter aquaticus TaxID=2975157 RepID=UPI0021BD3305|nr:phosphatase [Marinilongibacter aquaticus]UBM58982.1 phosphatase [Marinilongibacter aquaticus]